MDYLLTFLLIFVYFRAGSFLKSYTALFRVITIILKINAKLIIIKNYTL